MKIAIDVAEKEWIKFLNENDAESLIPKETLKNSEVKEDNEEYSKLRLLYDRAIKAIANGFITIEDGIITQLLKYPICEAGTKNVLYPSLVFCGRWTAKDRKEVYKGMKEGDISSAMAAQQKLCSILTGVDNTILDRLDLTDLKITDAIVSVFFT